MMTSASNRWSTVSEWRRHMRWFAAEFMVVVAGILVALWLQAYWQGRENSERESTYLAQLSEDLRETTRRLVRADSLHAVGERAQSKLLFAFQKADPPPLDSIAVWLWGTVLRPNSPVPVMGTIDALISTGDLRLIRNDSLRSAILAYASSMASAAAMEARTTDETVFGLKHEIAARVDYVELQARFYSPSQLESMARDGAGIVDTSRSRRSRFPLDRESMLNDRVLYTAIIDLSRAKGNLHNLRVRMQADTDTLQRKIDGYRLR